MEYLMWLFWWKWLNKILYKGLAVLPLQSPLCPSVQCVPPDYAGYCRWSPFLRWIVNMLKVFFLCTLPVVTTLPTVTRSLAAISFHMTFFQTSDPLDGIIIDPATGCWLNPSWLILNENVRLLFVNSLVPGRFELSFYKGSFQAKFWWLMAGVFC